MPLAIRSFGSLWWCPNSDDRKGCLKLVLLQGAFAQVKERDREIGEELWEFQDSFSVRHRDSPAPSKNCVLPFFWEGIGGCPVRAIWLGRRNSISALNFWPYALIYKFWAFCGTLKSLRGMILHSIPIHITFNHFFVLLLLCQEWCSYFEEFRTGVDHSK